MDPDFEGVLHYFTVEIAVVVVGKLQKVATDILKLKKYICDGFPMTSVRFELEKPSMVALVPISAILDGCANPNMLGVYLKKNAYNDFYI